MSTARIDGCQKLCPAQKCQGFEPLFIFTKLNEIPQFSESVCWTWPSLVRVAMEYWIKQPLAQQVARVRSKQRPNVFYLVNQVVGRTQSLQFHDWSPDCRIRKWILAVLSKIVEKERGMEKEIRKRSVVRGSFHDWEVLHSIHAASKLFFWRTCHSWNWFGVIALKFFLNPSILSLKLHC